MDSNTEIKKVITVDLGNTATSLKDYKKHIDDLRGSLLQLDETSEEYKTVSQEIKKEQDKLNEVMKAGKYDVDQAEGSYNQLTKTMSELKKEWKATGDEARRAELGQQILDINNQLKELDQSTGDFHRSVGDYANAFEQAFDKCLDGVKNLDGPIGDLGGTVKNLLPVIKSVNQTAVAGLSGVKKALASTGIGLLIVAVGELIAHWKELTQIVGVSEDEITGFKEKALNTLESVVIGAFGVGNALGNFLLAPIRTIIQSFIGLGNVIKDVFSGDFTKAAADAKAAINGIGEAWTKAFDWSVNIGVGKEIGYQFVERIRSITGSDEAIEAAEETGTEVGKSFSKGMSKAIEESDPETVEKIDPAAQAILDRLHKRNTDEIELLREKYEEEKALLEQYGLDTTDLTREFEEEAEKIIDKRLEAERNATIAIQKEEEKRTEDAKKEEEKRAKVKKMQQQALLSNTAALFGALADMSEENSEEQKAFAIMETIINTLQSIMGIWAGYSEMGPWGVAAAAVQTAAVTATGIATIAKMKSTTKESAGSGASVSVPQASVPTMTSVSPLLNEQDDLNRLEAYGQNIQAQQNIRCYVVEQDISDAQNKVQVMEDNVTF